MLVATGPGRRPLGQERDFSGGRAEHFLQTLLGGGEGEGEEEGGGGGEEGEGGSSSFKQRPNYFNYYLHCSSEFRRKNC